MWPKVLELRQDNLQIAFTNNPIESSQLCEVDGGIPIDGKTDSEDEWLAQCCIIIYDNTRIQTHICLECYPFCCIAIILSEPVCVQILAGDLELLSSLSLSKQYTASTSSNYGGLAYVILAPN